MAAVVLLTRVYHLSRRGAQSMLQEFFGISISLGALSAMEGRAVDALDPAYEEAKLQVEEALVKHTDATSWLLSGKLDVAVDPRDRERDGLRHLQRRLLQDHPPLLRHVPRHLGQRPGLGVRLLGDGDAAGLLGPPGSQVHQLLRA